MRISDWSSDVCSSDLAEKAGGQEEGDGVMAIPPLRHRVLHAGEEGIALGAGERCRNREVVDDVQEGDDQYERQIVPVGDVDVRLLAPRERAQIKDQDRKSTRLNSSH